MSYATLYNKRATPQSEPIPGETQVENSAGGYVYALDQWKRFHRFLILGSDAPTYYASAKALTRENAENVERCIAEDGQRAVDLIVAISDAGRAPKNDPALFALALATVAQSDVTRTLAYRALPKVCRIPTHLFHFAEYRKALGGWGSGMRNAVARWYNEQPVERLAHAVVKYRQRDGWTHTDLLAKAHPVAVTPQHNALYRWIDGSGVGERALTNKTGAVVRRYPSVADIALPAIIAAYEEAQGTTDVQRLCTLIREHGLTREMLPTACLTQAVVWEALLEQMPMTAVLRNLGNMAKVGLLSQMSHAASTVCARVTDGERLNKARIHPLTLLVALKIYQQGHGDKGKGAWSPVGQIVDALDAAFYLSFGAVEPTGKRQLLALDVSGSMGWGNLAGLPITPREASAALAMVVARTEPNYGIIAFDTATTELSISPRQRLDDVVNMVAGLQMAGTDCALPMLWAMEKKVDIDAFQIFTDNETWAGRIHPSQALRQYRRDRGIPAKLIVHGMTSTGFTIADPNDSGMMDVVGMDTSVPTIISEFIAGHVS